MLTLDMGMRPIEQLENDLDKFGEKALPYATRDTLNTLAYKAMEAGREEVGKKMVERNTWTRRSIAYEKATFHRQVDRMRSAMGSRETYMRQQEEGFTQHKSGKHGVAIPTGAAAGQLGARVRTKRLLKKNWLGNLNPSRGKGVRRLAATTVAVRDAVATGNRTIFLNRHNDRFGRPSGFYRIIGGRKGGHGWPKGAKLQMVYATEKASVRTEPHKWMEPAVDKVMKQFDQFYREAVIRQIEKNRLFRNR